MKLKKTNRSYIASAVNRPLRLILIAALTAFLILSLTACGSVDDADDPAISDDPNMTENQQEETNGFDSTEQEEAENPESTRPLKPAIPEYVGPDLEYLFDFEFAKRYDERISEHFALTLPESIHWNGLGKAPTGEPILTIPLFAEYHESDEFQTPQVLSGDGMVPHDYRVYRYDLTETQSTQGRLVVQTDYYQPDDLEFVGYVWTDIPGAYVTAPSADGAEPLTVAVGDAEEDLLKAYTKDLFRLGPNDLEPMLHLIYDIDSFSEEEWEQLRHPQTRAMNCDYAIAYQPFTAETNECRDITFYIKDGVITSIEMMEPFELRYVYGYDRETGQIQSE